MTFGQGWPAIRGGLAAADAVTWGAVIWQTAANPLFGYAARGWAAGLATLSQPPVARAPVTASAPLDRLALVDRAVDGLRRAAATAEREDRKARGAAPSPPHGAGERGGLERRA